MSGKCRFSLRGVNKRKPTMTALNHTAALKQLVIQEQLSQPFAAKGVIFFQANCAMSCFLRPFTK
jgi:hypothetical protein